MKKSEKYFEQICEKNIVKKSSISVVRNLVCKKKRPVFNTVYIQQGLCLKCSVQL